jgi:tetratricopeptide (TPR) repeat protein
VEGTVQRDGNRMRINVQLVDAETGTHLWADRFDKRVAALFDMRDEIVARLANTLNAQLVTAEARRAERAPSPDSMDLYFQGLAWANTGYSPDNIARARVFFERGLALDPGNVDVLILFATTDTIAAIGYYSDDRRARLLAAEEALTRALSMAPEHAFAHLQMGIVQIFSNRAARGIAECERALALDRNLTFAHGFIGIAKYSIGRGEETEAHVQEAIRLSPCDTSAYLWLGARGFAKLYLGADEEAVAWLRRAIDANRSFRCIISVSPPPWRISVGSMKRGPRFRQAWLSIRPSPFHAFAPVRRATIPSFLPSASESTRACTRPRCLRGEREPEISAILQWLGDAMHTTVPQPLALTLPARLKLCKGMGRTISTERL